MSFRDGAIDFGLRVFGATRLHRAAAPFARGLGAILMFHHVRPRPPREFRPNAGLEISPRFLDEVLRGARRAGYEIVSLGEALERLDRGGGRRFVALTFDDGYRDNIEFALPVLERNDAPFTMFVASGFADGTARLWWAEMERAIAALDRVRLEIDGLAFDLPAHTPAQKQAAFEAVYWPLRAGGEDRLMEACARLSAAAGIDAGAIARELCLDWGEIETLSRHRLAEIGAHTVTHPRLAKLPRPQAFEEMRASRDAIAARLGAAPRFFAYPVGDPTSAGPREFEMARELGFSGAVTTRPGVLYREHRDWPLALPRVSVNGLRQDWTVVETLLSGAPFLLWNRGRRLSVG